MLGKYSAYIEELYDRADSILIIDSEGYVEYCATYDIESEHLAMDNFIGKHIFEVYPELDEENSTHYRVMRSGQPIINEEQTLVDLNGDTFSFINSTFPIISEGSDPIGTIELSILISKNHVKNKKNDKADAEEEALGEWHRKGMYSLDSIITQDPVVMQVKSDIRRLGYSMSNAMVWGETGTGKELVAESIHSLSPRSAGPFITVNCSAIPANLFEGLLFGTAKGSFTGARDSKGFIEMADKGTLFLDELNSMDIDLQPKLLQVIERQKLRRLGEEEERSVDVRFIAAMNESPEKAVESGKVREDLFYRLSVLEFSLPPLRDRTGDIELLLDHFIDHFNRSLGKNIKGLSPIARNTLLGYDFPGNVRELRNAVEYAVNMASDQISLTDLPSRITKVQEERRGPEPVDSGGRIPEGTFSLQEMVEDYERSILTKVLEESSSITAAGKRIGLSRQALQYKMQKYELKVDR